MARHVLRGGNVETPGPIEAIDNDWSPTTRHADGKVFGGRFDVLLVPRDGGESEIRPAFLYERRERETRMVRGATT
jgi:hypothetical protein